jgi:hypothetical protein
VPGGSEKKKAVDAKLKAKQEEQLLAIRKAEADSKRHRRAAAKERVRQQSAGASTSTAAAGEEMEDEAGEPEVAQLSEAMEAEVAATEDAEAEPEVAQSEAMEAEAAAVEAEADAAALVAVAQKLVGKARAAAMAPEQRKSQEPWEGQQPDETRPARSGWLRRTVSPISEPRYGDVYRFTMYASVLVPKTGKAASKAVSHHVVTINSKFTSRKETYDERLAEAAAELNKRIWATLKPFMADHMPQKRQRRVGSAGAGSSGSAAAESEKASEGSDDEHNSPPTQDHGHGGARGGAGATPVEVHWRTGLPSGNSRYYNGERQYSSVQEAMLAHARKRILALQLELAQMAAALTSSEETNRLLKRDFEKLRQWALTQEAVESNDDTNNPMPKPQALPNIFGDGYSPSERTRTFYRHWERFWNNLMDITGGDLLKAQQLFEYGAVKLGIKPEDDDGHGAALNEIQQTRNAIILSLRAFFQKARQLQGDGRPVKKLGQAMQVVLTAVSHAPELGAASLAAVADELDLGSHGADKIKIGFLRGEAFLDEGNIEALYDDRCKKRSDCISDEQVRWLIHECWLSNEFTRESEKKKDEIFDPSSTTIAARNARIASRTSRYGG